MGSTSSRLTVAIEAGGKSSRMGTDKSFVALLGKPLIEHILERVSGLGQDSTLIVTNRPEDYAHLGLPTFTDIIPEKGSLGGIYSALYYSRSAYTLVVACDMPFLNPALLHYITTLKDEIGDPYDVIIPRVDNHPQGFHALYSARCLEPIRTDLEANRLKVIGFHNRVRVRYIDPAEYVQFDPQGYSFYNINTPQELEQARRLMETPNPHEHP